MDIKGKVIVISNRDVDPTKTDLRLFGDNLNPISEAEINIATAEKNNGNWQLELLTNSETPDYYNPVSRDLFKEIIKQAKTDPDKKNWVLFVHGFNQSLEKNLEKCLEIASYGVNVATFSWPSNPGPQQFWKKLKEYKRARKNARRSVLALERTLEKLADYMEEFSDEGRVSDVSLVIHSLGNYLFENVIKSDDFSEETRIFDNVMLHQADANNKGHRYWVEKVSEHTRVYVTINEDDSALSGSNLVNSDRLGNTTTGLNAEDVHYMDFTNGLLVDFSHRPWSTPGKKNAAIGDFYTRIFNSQRAEKANGWHFIKQENLYRLVDLEEVDDDD